jgi:hypothetical protein
MYPESVQNPRMADRQENALVMLLKKYSITGVTVRHSSLFDQFFSRLRFYSSLRVAELYETRKKLHFCLYFTLEYGSTGTSSRL